MVGARRTHLAVGAGANAVVVAHGLVDGGTEDSCQRECVAASDEAEPPADGARDGAEPADASDGQELPDNLDPPAAALPEETESIDDFGDAPRHP